MFEDRLKKLRLARGLSQSQIAEELGIPQKTYCNYERNEREPSSNMLIRLGKYFGVTLDYLLDYHCDRSLSEEINANKSNDKPTDNDIKFALFNTSEGITDEMLEEVKQFAEMVKLREEARKK